MAKIRKKMYRGNVIYYGKRSKSVPSRRKSIIREKVLPEGSKYNIEVRLCRVHDHDIIKKYGGMYLTAKQGDAWIEVMACLDTLRTMGSGYKIILKRERNMLQAKVLLEREGDLMLMMMSHPQTIFRVYKLVDQRKSVVPSETTQ